MPKRSPTDTPVLVANESAAKGKAGIAKYAGRLSLDAISQRASPSSWWRACPTAWVRPTKSAPPTLPAMRMVERCPMAASAGMQALLSAPAMLGVKPQITSVRRACPPSPWPLAFQSLGPEVARAMA